MNKDKMVACSGTIMSLEQAEKLNMPIYEVTDDWVNSILDQSYQAFINGENNKTLSAENNGKRINRNAIKLKYCKKEGN